MEVGKVNVSFYVELLGGWKTQDRVGNERMICSVLNLVRFKDVCDLLKMCL